MKYRIAFPLMCCLFGFTFSTFAQDNQSCPTIVQTALETVDTLCSETARNQACYGNVMLEAQPQPDVTQLVFDAPGDITEVMNIRSLKMSPMDEAAGVWGISLLRLQADLPETLPGQNVTVLLFGDVEIQTAERPTEMPVTVVQGKTINVRSGPSTNNSLVTTLAPETAVIANGRNEAGDWLRIVLPDDLGTGWAFAGLVEAETDLAELDVVNPDESVYGPMQSFYFRSGIGDSPCREAPSSGIMIQSPKGAGNVRLNINGADIVLGSTAYLEANPNDSMNVYLLEGQGSSTVQGEQQNVFAGTRTSIPIDGNLQVSGVASAAEPYRMEVVQALQAVADRLPEPITITPPVQFINVGYPSGCEPDTMPAGTPIMLHYGMGWRNDQERTSAIDGPFGFTINGAAVSVDARIVWEEPQNVESRHFWGTPEPGVYHIVVTDRREIRPCTVTIEER